MVLPTGKPLLHLLLHPIILQCLRKLTEYPFTGRLILNTINVGRKLHFLVFIIDKKDSLIYRAQRKGPSVCPDLRGGPGKQGTCPSVWLCVHKSVGKIPHSRDWNWVLAPSDSSPLCPWAEGDQAPHSEIQACGWDCHFLLVFALQDLRDLGSLHTHLWCNSISWSLCLLTNFWEGPRRNVLKKILI